MEYDDDSHYARLLSICDNSWERLIVSAKAPTQRAQKN